mgnify:CR=1 FL=1
MKKNTESTTDSGFEMHREQFARLAGMSECGMMIAKMQAEPEIMYANDGFFRLAGYSRSEYSMQFHNDTSELVYPEDMDMVSMVIRQAIENRGPLAMEYRIMAKSGEIRWSYINGTRIDDDNGQPVYLCVIVDITARKQAEAELADNNHRSNVITKMLRETIWTYDMDAHVLHRDGDLGGTYSPETILEGQFTDENIRAIIHPDDVEKFIQMRNSWDADAGMHQDIFRVINGNGAYQASADNSSLCAQVETKTA